MKKMVISMGIAFAIICGIIAGFGIMNQIMNNDDKNYPVEYIEAATEIANEYHEGEFDEIHIDEAYTTIHGDTRIAASVYMDGELVATVYGPVNNI